MIQNNEEVKNDLLLTTDYTAQETPFQISQSLSVATENVDTSVIATTAISTSILQENMPLNTQTSEYDIKDKVCSKIMDETTLRIYFPIVPKGKTVTRTSKSSLYSGYSYPYKNQRRCH